MINKLEFIMVFGFLMSVLGFVSITFVIADLKNRLFQLEKKLIRFDL